MGLNYHTTLPMTIIGTKTAAGVRTGYALTTAYQTESGTQPTKSFRTSGYSELVLDIVYTLGSAETTNTVSVKVEDSPDGINYYQLTNEAASSGTSTLTQREFAFVGADTTAPYAFSYRLDTTYKWMRVSCKEAGVAANAGNVYIEAQLGGA